MITIINDLLYRHENVMTFIVFLCLQRVIVTDLAQLEYLVTMKESANVSLRLTGFTVKCAKKASTISHCVKVGK